jgi:chloramphenicol-sensitive protein RarD
MLLASTGIVTAVPLLCFGAAAIRVPMTTLGLLQYLAPVLQFLLGVTVLDEHMSPMRWVGFGLVWVALVMFTAEAGQYRRTQARLALEAAAL